MRRTVIWWLAISVMMLLVGACSGDLSDRVGQQATTMKIHDTNVEAKSARCVTIPSNTPQSAFTTRVVDTLFDWVAFATEEQLIQILDRTGPAESSDSQEPRNCLRSAIAYTLDTGDGTRYLQDGDIAAWSLQTDDGAPLTNPTDFVIHDSHIYVLDRGAVYVGRLPVNDQPNTPLQLTAILTSQTLIDGYPVQEIAAIDVREDDGLLVAIDKATDIYIYRSGQDWRLLPQAQANINQELPQYVDLEASKQGLFLLDVAENQVLRHDWDDQQSILPRSQLLLQFDPLQGGIDLLQLADMTYVLTLDAKVIASLGQQVNTWVLPATSETSHIPEILDAPLQPTAIMPGPDEDTISIVDPGTRRIVILDRQTGAQRSQIVAPRMPQFEDVSGAQSLSGQVYLIAPGSLYRIDLAVANQIENAYPQDKLPVWEESESTPPKSFFDVAPNAPTTLAALESLTFEMPIAGAALPDRFSLYPGARRSYRHGIHFGIDLFSDDSGVPIRIGTPVRAVADGMVMRADTNYREMSVDEVSELLEESQQQRGTSRTALEKLGGRQIWIYHGNGLWTKYSHLDRIAAGISAGEKVSAGDFIGTVGVSGTPDGITGLTSGAHLHFEIWIGKWPRYYVGQWLRIDETYRIFQKIFTNATTTAGFGDPTSSEPTLGPALDSVVGTPLQPADHYWFLAPFDTRYNQIYSPIYPFGSTAGGIYRPHHGIDISNPAGAEILAIGDGIVTYAGPDNPELLGPYNDFYGNSVVVRLERPLLTAAGALDVYLLYGHLQDTSVDSGQHLKTGDIVGHVGETGIALGPHLHLEVRVENNEYESAMNPDLWIKPISNTGNLAVRAISADGRSWEGAPLEVFHSAVRSKSPAWHFETYLQGSHLANDPTLHENAVLKDVPVGEYYVVLTIRNEKVEQHFAIKAGETTFVRLQTKQ